VNGVKLALAAVALAAGCATTQVVGTMITPNGYEIPNQMVFHGYVVFRCR